MLYADSTKVMLPDTWAVTSVDHWPRWLGGSGDDEILSKMPQDASRCPKAPSMAAFEVMAFPEGEDVVAFPEKFGTSGRCHRHLQMTLGSVLLCQDMLGRVRRLD